MRGRLGVLAVVLLAACSDSPDPTSTTPLRPQASTVGNIDHFSFLPPLAEGSVTGEFNPYLRPALEICRLANDACVEQLAFFETKPGEIEVSLENEHYKVNWQITGVIAGELYRVAVLSGPWPNATVMGAIDLVGAEGGGLVSPSGSGAPNIESTLPIKFRLEAGVLCTTLAGDNLDEPCLVVSVGPPGGTFVNKDSTAGASFPVNALSEYVNFYLEKFEEGDQYTPGSNTYCLPTSQPQYGNCFRFLLEPKLTELPGQATYGEFNYEVTVGVCPDPTVFQQGIFDQVDLYKWDESDPASLEYLPEKQIGFVNCPGTPYYTDHGIAAASWLPEPLRGLARLFAPSALHAGIISPFGGGLKDFSRIGWLRPLALSKTSGDAQTGYVGLPLVDDPTVRVTAAGAKVTPGTIPVSGVPVQFAATDGSASPTTAVTSAGGYASTVWTLGASAGAQSLVATATNPLAPGSSDVFPNQDGVWGTVTFGATAVELPPPPPPASYKVVFLSPVQKGKATPKDQNVLGVPVTVQVCATSVSPIQCWPARRIVANGDYRFQWKAESDYPAGSYTFSVLNGSTVLHTLTAVVAKEGSSPPKGVDFTFQLGSTVPIKFLLIAK